MLPNSPVTTDLPGTRPESPSRNGAVPHAPHGPGWIERVRRSLFGGHAPRVESQPRPVADGTRGSCPSGGEIRSMTQHLIAEDRYVFVLLEEAFDFIGEREAASAWKSLEAQMALIPGGVVPVLESNGNVVPTELAAFYLDRTAVTNRQFHRFVLGGGYDNMEIWPQEVWPSLIRFCDRTGRPGPRHWENGKFPGAKPEHPVPGASGNEAPPYSHGAGNRPPPPPRRQKAGGRPG